MRAVTLRHNGQVVEGILLTGSHGIRVPGFDTPKFARLQRKMP
jgi:hypothetical protein